MVVLCLFPFLRRAGAFRCEALGPPELVLVEVDEPAAAAEVHPLELQDVEVEAPPDGCCC